MSSKEDPGTACRSSLSEDEVNVSNNGNGVNGCYNQAGGSRAS